MHLAVWTIDFIPRVQSLEDVEPILFVFHLCIYVFRNRVIRVFKFASNIFPFPNTH